MAVGMRWNALVCLALVFCSPAFCLRTARTDFTRCTTIRSNTCLIRGATKSMSDSERLYELLKESDVRPKYPEREEIIAMIDAGVARCDNFWESTFPITKKRRLAASQGRDMEGRLQADKSFINLMKTGFERRLFTSSDGTPEEQARNVFLPRSPVTMLRDSAEMTSAHLELSVTKEEQLKALKQQQLFSRSGLMRLIPLPLHKYIDYLFSLRKDPKPEELVRNLAVSGVFATVTMMNARARMAAMYSLIGNLAIMSILLMRNMPKLNVPMGMDRNRVVNWSPTSFRTAVGVSAVFALTGGLVVGGGVSLLPALEASMKARLALAASVLTAGFCTSYFEVFEEKGQNGMRWKRALEGTLPPDVQARLRQQVYGQEDAPMTELYDYAYDPQIDDYPPLPKYIDEVNPGEVSVGGSGELDEDESKDHYEAWRAERRDARKAPVLEARPEEKWVGSKKGMFVETDSVPRWLNAAYTKNVLQANKWRAKPTKYAKDTAEFDPIEGPVGFRDKRPDWLDAFGPGIWEEKLKASRAAAREFGTYRKTMWKIDKEVKLKPCDGADKEV